MAYYIFDIEGKLAVVQEASKEKAEKKLRNNINITNRVKFVDRKNSFSLASTVYGFFHITLV